MPLFVVTTAVAVIVVARNHICCPISYKYDRKQSLSCFHTRCNILCHMKTSWIHLNEKRASDSASLSHSSFDCCLLLLPFNTHINIYIHWAIYFLGTYKYIKSHQKSKQKQNTSEQFSKHILFQFYLYHGPWAQQTTNGNGKNIYS